MQWLDEARDEREEGEGERETDRFSKINPVVDIRLCVAIQFGPKAQEIGGIRWVDVTNVVRYLKRNY